MTEQGAEQLQQGADVLRHVYEKAAVAHATIILPEGEDPRIIEAARIAEREKAAEKIIVLTSDSFDSYAEEQISPLVQVVLEARGEKDGLADDSARELLRTNTKYLAAALVKAGMADGYVAGSICETRETIHPALKLIGTREGYASSFFLMIHEGRALFFADCGFNIDPTAEQLARIAIDTAHNAEALGVKPIIAFLSFSTKGSATHESVDKMVEAGRIAKERAPHLVADSELQFDAAFVADIGVRKAPGSPVAGRANVFIFPDLNSGNIAYKIAERMGGARAIGPLMQGLNKPVNDLSRGCSVRDIVDAIAFTSMQSRG